MSPLPYPFPLLSEQGPPPAPVPCPHDQWQAALGVRAHRDAEAILAATIEHRAGPDRNVLVVSLDQDRLICVTCRMPMRALLGGRVNTPPPRREWHGPCGHVPTADDLGVPKDQQHRVEIGGCTLPAGHPPLATRTGHHEAWQVQHSRTGA